MRKNIMILLCAVLAAQLSAQVRVGVSISANFSFNELNEYGEWVTVEGYGEVWRPYVSAEWRPFKYGRWIWSNDGWLWESYEPFGWIVCHYGNWYFDDEWGWVWVPGYEWSPARVEWYVTDHEIGWAPLLPPPRPGRRVHAHVHWSFCPIGVFGGVEIHNHIVVREAPKTVVVYKGPPKIEFVRSRAKVKVVTIAPRKVTVRSSQRSFVRVETAASRPQVVVPVGPQYRAHYRKAPERAVSVETTVEPRSHSVTVTTERAHEYTPTPRHHRSEVRTESHHYGSPKVKVRVESRNGEEEEEEEEESERSGKVKVKVKKKY